LGIDSLVAVIASNGLSSCLLAIWTFGSSGMLLWGFAALLPIVLHLWSRRKYRRVSWAAMDYLLAAVQKHARRMRLEQWVLLSLRVLILLLLALALADPVVSWLSLATAGRQGQPSRHFVLVLDGSYSMGAKQEGVARFELAKGVAEKWLRRARQGDGFTLVMMANPPQVVIRTPAFDIEDVLQELNDLQLSHGMASLEATLTEVEQLVEQVRQDQPRLEETVIGIFTDMGETTWQIATDRRAVDQLTQLTESSRLQVVDVGTSDPVNVAITRCQLASDWITVRQEVSWETEIRNFSSRTLNGQQVEFWVDGQRVHQQRVDLDPGSQVAVSHRVRFDVPGEHQIEVRTSGDALATDNRRWVSVRVREALEVLCVEGRPGAARYVDLSLNPTNIRQPQVHSEIVSESGLLERDLRRYAAIFLCNVGRFSSEESNVLYEYLQGAGTVVFFLGDQVEISDYNEYLGAARKERRILPVRLLAAVPTSTYRFDPLEYQHPIVAPFRGQVRSGLLTSPIARYIRAEPYTDQQQAAPKVALQFFNSDPAIIEERIGRGHSIVFTTAASPQSTDASQDPPVPWSDLGTWPSFLPLVQETLALAVRTQEQPRNVQVGQLLEIRHHEASPAVRVEVINPRGESEHVAVSNADRRMVWWYDATLLSGLYEARFGAPVDSSRWFAANVDTRESDLTRSDSTLLPDQIEVADLETEMVSGEVTTSAGRPIYRYLLAGLLCLLFTESSYACYVGRASG
jgi:hypothetical protein